jgi:transposase InsO family protein
MMARSRLIARVLFDHVLSRFGTPRRILTDQGTEFEGQLFKNLCQLLQINKVRTSPYKPSTNGMLERFHRTLNAMIAKIVDENQRNWCEMIPSVMAAYRATVHETTGYSPNKLLLGKENRMPIDLIFGVFRQANLRTNQSTNTSESWKKHCMLRTASYAGISDEPLSTVRTGTTSERKASISRKEAWYGTSTREGKSDFRPNGNLGTQDHTAFSD